MFQRQKYFPQVTVNIVGSDEHLNQNIADHLKISIQNIGCTVAIRNAISVSDVSWEKGSDFYHCLKQLRKKWEKVQDEISNRSDIEDFLINVQTVEHLSALTTVMQNAVANERNASEEIKTQLKKVVEKEKESVFLAEKLNSDESHLRLRLYVLKDEKPNQVDCVIEHSCKMTSAMKKITFTDGVDRPGDIWSMIYGIISAEEEFKDLLQMWAPDPKVIEKKYKYISGRRNRERIGSERFA